MSIYKSLNEFYSLIDSNDFKSIRLKGFDSTENPEFICSTSNEHFSEFFEGGSSKIFLKDGETQFLITDEVDSCPEIGVLVEGDLKVYKILVFKNPFGRYFTLQTVFKINLCEYKEFDLTIIIE